MDVESTPGRTPSRDGVRRLVITEMVLENFKSYAGEQRVGPFHKSFSAVVGPNGSGKSNVIDAMLFVFGKRAQQLRLRKVSELIHHSAAAPNCTYAKVAVHFTEILDRGGDDFEEVPGTSLVVSRTAHRDNTSTYHVDGRPSSFGQVTQLLKGKGIDLDNNRFLILQGEVEQISMMKPKATDKNDTGLLEYLEDIIGTSRFVEPLVEMCEALEKLNEERQGVLQRVKVAETEVAALEGARQEAEAYLAKEREIRYWACAEAQLSLAKAQGNVAAIEDKIREVERCEKEEESQGQALASEHAEAERTFKAIEKEHRAIESEMEKVDADFRAFEARDLGLKEDLKHLKAKGKTAEGKAAKARTRLREATDGAEEAEAAGPELEARADKTEKQLERERAKVALMWEEVREDVEHRTVALQGARKALAPWEEKLTQARSQFEVAASEHRLLTGRAEEAAAKVAEAEEAIAAAEGAARERRAKAERLRGAEAEAAKDVARAERMAAEAAGREEQLSASLSDARARLEERRAALADGGGRGRVFRALDEAKRRRAIPGIYGRLGDLGTIDPKYDVAASQACAALDFVVVEDAQSAQACVELLRSQRLGVATFLILDKQRHLEADMRRGAQGGTPEGVPRLFDLVRVADDRLRVAFFFAMRDTVVADDLDQATRIAYGPDRRFRRVVTLAGELIVESGAVSGGGQGPPRSGRMRVGTRPPVDDGAEGLEREVEAVGREVSELEAALEEARAETATAKEALRAAQAELRDVRRAAPKAAMEAEAESAKAADLRAQVASLREAAAGAQAPSRRLAELVEEMARGEEAIASLESECGGLRAEVERLRKEVDDAGGAPLRRQKDLIARMEGDVEGMRAEAVRKRVQAQSLRKAVAKCEAEVAAAEKEAGEVAEAVEGKRKALRELEDEALVVMKKHQEVEALLASKRQALDEVREAYEERDRLMTDARRALGELRRKREALEKAAGEERKSAKYWAKEAVKRAEERKRESAADGDGAAAPGPLTEEELAAIAPGGYPDSLQRCQGELAMLQAAVADMDVDVSVIKRYRERAAEYADRAAELEACTARRDEARGKHEALRKQRLDEFMAGFNVIALKLKEMYQMITLGGDAELELVDSLYPFSEGVVFSVRPPRKSWKNIANLSGGEKTLSSLALVFALHHYRPTPLYVMDEIDAALDFRNVSIVGHYIKDRTRDAQFIIISLRNNMFELADRLVGIYKTHNMTKSVTIDPSAFVVAAGGGQAPGGDAAATVEGEQTSAVVAVA